MRKIDSTICPKCGHEVDNISFVKIGDMEIDAQKNRHAGELKRTCDKCGYYWYENSLDDNKFPAKKH